MADTITLNAGAGGAVLATDDIAGVHYQLIKLGYGALDAFTIVTTSAGLPVAQQGTWNVGQLGGTAVKLVDYDTTGGTDNIPLVGIAVTSALGAVAGGVSGTPLYVTLAPGPTTFANFEDAGSGDGDGGVTCLAVRKAVPANTSGSDGDYEFLQMSAGRLWVDPSGVTLTVGSHAVTNAGTFAVQIDSGAVTSLALIDDPVIQDDAAFTPATTKVMMAGFQADETGTDSVDEGDGGAARMTLDRKQIVTVEPHTAGGLSVFNATSGDGSTALTNSAQAIKASAGQLYGWYIYNPNAVVAYVPIYNTAAASVTVGTTNPLFVIAIPATSAANVIGANGIAFSNAGWSAAACTTAAGNTALGTAIDANFFYA